MMLSLSSAGTGALEVVAMVFQPEVAVIKLCTELLVTGRRLCWKSEKLI